MSLSELVWIFGTAAASLGVMLLILGTYARWLHKDAARRVDEWLRGT